MDQTSRRIIYHGRVQGVGFRARTSRLATGYSVSGYVKNLADGSVEVVVAGDVSEIQRFLDAIAREFSSKIRSIENSEFLWESVEPSGFEVRY